MKQAFVTGGSGFVGKALIRALAEQGTRVHALARSDSAERAVSEVGAKAVRGDLDDAAAMREGMKGCEVVFHAAAFVEQWGTREDFFRANVAGTANVIRAAREAGVSALVHVGTEAVLAGEAPIIQADESRPRAEHPAGLYSLTKGLAEDLVIEANSSAPSLRTMVIRPRLIWGKGDTSLLPKIAESVRSGVFMWVNHGRYLTSTCHIDNVVEGALLAASAALSGKGGEVYFLTDGPPVVFREFMGSMLKTLGLDPGDKSAPSWLVLALATALEAVWEPLGLDQGGKVAPPITKTAVKLIGEEVTVKDDKARRELGYRGKKSIEEGLQEMRDGG